MNNKIIYDVSLYPVMKRFIDGKANYWYFARHYTVDKKNPIPKIRIYLQGITEHIYQVYEEMNTNNKNYDNDFFEIFVYEFIYSVLMERTCLEVRLNNAVRVKRGLGKKLIRKRCQRYKKANCRMGYIAKKILKILES